MHITTERLVAVITTERLIAAIFVLVVIYPCIYLIWKWAEEKWFTEEREPVKPMTPEEREEHELWWAKQMLEVDAWKKTLTDRQKRRMKLGPPLSDSDKRKYERICEEPRQREEQG
jgi:hypothetical protein